MKKKTLIKLLVFSGITAISLLGCELKDSDYFSNPTSADNRFYTLNLVTTGEEEGTITSEDGKIDCPPDCDEEYLENLIVTLKANFNISTTHIRWTGDFEEFGSMDEIEVTMTSDMSGGVAFDPIPPVVDVLQTGVFAINGLTGLENAAYVGGVNVNYGSNKSYLKQVDQVNFGPLTGTFITAFTGAEGYQILDLATGEVLKEDTGLNSLGPYFGIAGAMQDTSESNSPVLIALGGLNGFVLDRLDQTGPMQFNGTTFDVFPAGGDPVTNVMTHVLPGAGVGFFVFDDAQNRYVAAEVGFPKELFGDVQLISVYMHDDILSDDPVPQPHGNFLALSQENESGVFLGKWDGSNPVRAIDNIGFDARRLRCIDDGTNSGNLICAASIFGHNRLGILTWDGENEPVLTDFAELDAGPVGIDLRNLPDGNIAVVSTGFDNNTFNETVLMPNGRVQSNSTQPVLNGCESPGHAIYIEDSEGYKILVTCYDSGSYMITESEFQ